MGPTGLVPPIKIKVGSFLPDTLPSRLFLIRQYALMSALYPARHQPSTSFLDRKAVAIFAGNTYKYLINRNYG